MNVIQVEKFHPGAVSPSIAEFSASPEPTESSVFQDTKLRVPSPVIAAADDDRRGDRPRRPRIPHFDPPSPSVPDDVLQMALRKLIRKGALPEVPLRRFLVVYGCQQSQKHFVGEE
jgi:hypothetical protein